MGEQRERKEQQRFILKTTLGWRANRQVYRVHGINYKELDALCAVSSYIDLKDVSQVSINTVMRWLGLTQNMKKKWFGFIAGCVGRGMLEQVLNDKGTHSLVLTDYGQKVVDDYFDYVEEFSDRELNMYIHKEKRRKSLRRVQMA